MRKKKKKKTVTRVVQIYNYLMLLVKFVYCNSSANINKFISFPDLIVCVEINCRKEVV